MHMLTVLLSIWVASTVGVVGQSGSQEDAREAWERHISLWRNDMEGQKRFNKMKEQVLARKAQSHGVTLPAVELKEGVKASRLRTAEQEETYRAYRAYQREKQKESYWRRRPLILTYNQLKRTVRTKEQVAVDKKKRRERREMKKLSLL
jgi:hypothetical protein